MARRPLSAWLKPGLILKALTIFVVGSLFGVGLFTFVYAKGFSYFGTDSKACVNCHVMQDQYVAWQAGSHKEVAGCNDCHAPHDNIVHKYYVKAVNGWNHGLKFTTGDYPQTIRITDFNARVTNNACLHCHEDYLATVHITRPKGQELNCISCHEDVGHK